MSPLGIRAKKPAPHAFVLDALEPLGPATRPMFGCVAVYVDDKIMLILRDKPDEHSSDNGVWIATDPEHHATLRRELRSMRHIQLLSSRGSTSWQNLPSDGPDFEEEALRACELVLKRDPRIGKVPKRKRPKGSTAPKRASASAKKKPRGPKRKKPTPEPSRRARRPTSR